MMSEKQHEDEARCQCEVHNELCLVTSHVRPDNASVKSRHTLSGFPLVAVIFSLCLAQFLSALDITIVATALPTIAAQLNATAAQYTWVGSAYNLAGTASTPLWAKFSDIWGRKPMLLLANALFMGGSLAAGLANSPSILILGRTFQGLGGGGIMILVSIIIADLFAFRDRAKYYGFSAFVFAIASAMGPVLGGVFTQTIGWRWCFFINLPFDGASLALLCWTLRIQTPKTPLLEGLRNFDWLGSMAVVGGTICFLCGLEGGASSMHPWTSAYTLGLLISGLVLLVLFVLIEIYYADSPLVTMRVFSGRVKVAAIFASFFHSFTFISYDYFLPLYFQVVLGASPLHSGINLFALVLPLSFMSALTGIYIKKTGNYHLCAWAGSTVMTIGTGLFINFGDQNVLWKIIVFQVVAGLGAGTLFLSPMLALQNYLSKEDISAGLAAFTFLRSIATSISIVVGGVVLQAGLHGTSLSATGGKDSSPLSKRSEVAPSNNPAGYSTALKHMWIFYTVMSGLTMVFSFMITKKKSENSSSETAPDTAREVSATRTDESGRPQPVATTTDDDTTSVGEKSV